MQWRCQWCMILVLPARERSPHLIATPARALPESDPNGAKISGFVVWFRDAARGAWDDASIAPT